MTYKTHIAFAILPIYVTESYFDLLPIHLELILYFAIGVGSLLPDFDEKGSWLSQKFPIFPIFYDLLGIKHREITHWAIFSITLSLLLLLIAYFNNGDLLTSLVYVGLSIGYFMHLAGDMLTKGGIDNFYYPISGKKGVLLPRGLRFYTNSTEEYMFFVLMLFIAIAQSFLRVY